MNEQVASFWDRQAPGYAAQPVKDVKSYDEMLIEVSKHLKSTDKVLEIGCGTGSTAVRMADQVSSWTGSDISDEMINIAKSKMAIGDANFVVSDADADFIDAPFDTVTAFHILHLVPDPKNTIANLYAQLKPGGLFISKTVCPGEMGLLPRIVLPVMKLFRVAPPTLHFLTTRDLQEMIRSAGFEILEQRHFGTNKNSPFFVARRPT